MYEIISPNVTHITPLNIPDREVTSWVKVHPKGVIEIQNRYDTPLLDAVLACFDYYDAWGQLYPVSVTGLKTSTEPEKVGSVRFCAWDGAFADSLTRLINEINMPELIRDGDCLYRFEAVSKYFRFMRYKKGGEHFPHYDSDFEVFDSRDNLLYATKYSLVMYFNDCDTGEIAFINHDGKDRTDWTRQATDEEIFLKIKPKAGKIVLFPHDVCHTVLPYNDDGKRYICRGDLIFTKE